MIQSATQSQVIPGRFLYPHVSDPPRPDSPAWVGLFHRRLSDTAEIRPSSKPDLVEGESNPWSLLKQRLEPGVVPAIGDYNSVFWILHLGLGDELTMTDELGETLRLRIVGLLRESLFQSELVIA